MIVIKVISEKHKVAGPGVLPGVLDGRCYSPVDPGPSVTTAS